MSFFLTKVLPNNRERRTSKLHKIDADNHTDLGCEAEALKESASWHNIAEQALRLIRSPQSQAN
jgi:hypothetical protein